MPPEFKAHPTDTSAPAQGNVTMSCSATGFPIPDVSWFKDGVLLTVDAAVQSNAITVDSQISLTRVDVNDSASYVCRAINILGSEQMVDSDPGELQVQCK